MNDCRSVVCVAAAIWACGGVEPAPGSTGSESAMPVSVSNAAAGPVAVAGSTAPARPGTRACGKGSTAPGRTRRIQTRGSPRAGGASATARRTAPTAGRCTSTSYQATLAVTDNLGRCATATLTVTALPHPGPVPVAVFETPGTGPAPLDVYFDGTRSHVVDPNDWIASCRWDFGDGSPPEDCCWAHHVYQQPGHYAVRFTVTDEVRVHAAPVRRQRLDAGGGPVQHRPGDRADRRRAGGDVLRDDHRHRLV